MTDLNQVQRRHKLSLANLQPVLGRSSIDEFQIQGVKFELFTSLKPGTRHLLVFGQGTVDRAHQSLPVFHRWSWAEEIDASVVVLNDPTLYLGSLSLGWFVGTPDFHYLPIACQIVQTYAGILGHSNRSILFYGSSGGGFTSLIMAATLPGACAMVNNPQTDILRYHERHIQELLTIALNGISVSTAKESYAERLSAAVTFQSLGRIPNLFFVQNSADGFHFKNHMMPFLESVYGMIWPKDGIRNARIITEVYQDEKAHNPLGKDETLARLAFTRAELLRD